MKPGYVLASCLAAAILITGTARAAGEPASDPSLIARGSYLAKAADCMPCHTSARDKPYAGGLKLNTPFGAIYSPNVTPDRETGIGAWTFDVGIIWAVPGGYSLAERDPGWQPALKCPPNDNSRVPQALVAAALPIRGKPDLNFLASDAIAQADRMLTQHPKAKPADLANALILAYCEGVAPLVGVRDVEKSGSLMRYGEEVIQRLQLKAEMQERAPAAAKAAR